QLPTPRVGLVDFCSNDYLGYARMSFPASGPQREGATGSRLISGNSALAEAVEAEIAAFHRAEAGLIFSSGYAANLGLLSALCQRQDTIIYDQLLHASLRDGIRLTRSRALGFGHNDLADLRKKLTAARIKNAGQLFVIVESVYSMDGDQAPLLAMADCCEEFGANLIVDEAHGTGVLGPRGEGGVVAAGLNERVFARVHTFGKAIGSHGAIVLGSATLRSYLINFARPFIYSTGIPDATLARIQSAYRELKSGTALLRLRQLITYFQNQCPVQLQEQLLPSTTPIQALVCPGNSAVVHLAQRVQSAGFQVLPIRYPTVPAGEERLRICLHVFNTESEIDQLLTILHSE
ncbi:MAG: aminotransferase class I/II-fold pyridoxal phosphate-dependent enzyme, partial [Bacteroidota bacterium]